MLTLKAGQIQPISTAITQLIKDSSITKKQKYWLFRFIGKFESEMQNWDKIYMELVTKYAVRDENNEMVKEGNGIKIGDIPGFQNELAEISDQDITIEFDKIVIFESALPDSITAQQMYILKDVIEFTEDMIEGPPLQLVK